MLLHIAGSLLFTQDWERPRVGLWMGGRVLFTQAYKAMPSILQAVSRLFTVVDSFC